MTTLPLAPLTTAELRTRIDDLKSSIAWYVAAVADSGGEFMKADLKTLRERGEELSALSEALEARTGLTA